MFLRGYLNKLCSDPSQMEFWQYLDKVGMMHVGQGRTHPLHVEYVHIGVTLSFIQDVVTEAILSHPRMKMERKIALVKALSKVIWIQNDLFAKWYVRDGDEFEGEEVLVPEIEPEGWLHGRKVVGDVEEGLESGMCPFKDLAESSRGVDVDVRDDVDKLGLDANGVGADDIRSGPHLSRSAIPRVVGSSA
jgi:hypothetical protein